MQTHSLPYFDPPAWASCGWSCAYLICVHISDHRRPQCSCYVRGLVSFLYLHVCLSRVLFPFHLFLSLSLSLSLKLALSFQPPGLLQASVILRPHFVPSRPAAKFRVGGALEAWIQGRSLLEMSSSCAILPEGHVLCHLHCSRAVSLEACPCAVSLGASPADMHSAETSA